MDAREIIQRCRLLAAYTTDPPRTSRPFLSTAMRDVYKQVGEWMQEAGLRVHVDAAGNLRGQSGKPPRLMIGSHLDTVPDAGAFDGVLGVMMGIALADGRDADMEVIGFSDEEGVRFGTPFIGSRAVVGNPVIDGAVLRAIRDFGLEPEKLPDAVADIQSYLEFHIEQGPVLESLGLPLGVVEAIAGQSRMEVRFKGSANHAGTTPMHLRRDALAAAAEWVTAVEREAVNTAGLVATVGKIEVLPGAANVIAGEARASLDVRHAWDEIRIGAAHHLVEEAQRIAIFRRLTVEWESRLDQPAVPLHADRVAPAVEAAGFAVHRMVSGAGHDAMIMARKFPSAMLFLRTPGGVSHHPDEAVLEEDVEAALAVGTRLLG